MKTEIYHKLHATLSMRYKHDLTITFTTTAGKKEVIQAKYDGFFFKCRAGFSDSSGKRTEMLVEAPLRSEAKNN